MVPCHHDRVLRRVALLNVVATVAVSMEALLDGRWWLGGVGGWLLLVGAVALRPPDRNGPLLPRVRQTAVLVIAAGLPMSMAVAALVARRGASAVGLAIAVATGVGLLSLWGALVVVDLLVRRQSPPPRRPRAPRGRPGRIALAAALAVPVVAVPVGADAVMEARLLDRLRKCPFALGVAPEHQTRQLRKELAAACDLAAGGPMARRTVDDMVLSLYRGRHRLDPVAIDDAASALAHYRSLLGPPQREAVAVLPVRIAGPVRGVAGPAFVIVDEPEMARWRDCRRFRQSAGVEGRCGSWVVAHELGHQWFRWSAYRLSPPFWPVVWEGTSDYLAFDWWRSQFGEEDARALGAQLFDGRMALDRLFAATHVPTEPPHHMSDLQGRALVYGRASASWLAVEHAVGAEGARRALRAVYEAGLEPSPSLEAVLVRVEGVEPKAAEILRVWWTQRGFDPRLSPPTLSP